jgi:hypothetical protein
MIGRRFGSLAAPVVLIASLELGSGHALAQSPGNGNSGNAPGQGVAAFQCGVVIYRQETYGPETGGGPKSTDPNFSGPTNCDHFWQSSGYIGNP